MRYRIRKFLKDDFLRHTGIMVAGTGLANIFNLLYQLAVVRLLSVDDYGVLNSLVALTVIFSQFSATFRPALTRFLAEYYGRGESERAGLLLRKAAVHLGLLSAIILVVFVLGAGPLARYQQIESRLYILLVGILVAVSTMAVIPDVFLWGAQRFKYLACLGASSTLVKLALGVGLVWTGWGVVGALAGYNACPLFVLIAGIVLIRFTGVGRGTGSKQEPGVSMAPVYRYCIPTALALFSFAILTNLDVFLVKHFFQPREAGLYSVAQIVGKIILYLPGAVSIVVFSKAASARARAADSFPLLKKGLIAVGLINVLATSVCALAPGTVLKMLTGKTDPESVRLVVWFALAMSLYALTWLNIFYNLSVHNTAFIKYLVIIAAAQAAAIYLYHPGLMSVLGFLNIFAFISFIVTLYFSWTDRRDT
ncbi:MAG: oligosaccharide flippase family protein [Candidatus Tritonobacter lacicola]|nr:oligosaccharide flippase family protein [Candidatus Tritonobacter lacicola]